MRIARQCILGAACLALAACNERKNSASAPEVMPNASVETAAAGAHDRLTVEKLKQIAIEHLSVGLRTDEVYNILTAHGLTRIYYTNSISFVSGWGHEPSDPILWITAMKSDDGELRITEWEIEK